MMETQSARSLETAIVPEAKRPVVDERPRCWRCDKLLAISLSRPWHIVCPRCHATNKQQ